MRREFEMSEEDLGTLLDAMKPEPYLVAGGISPLSPQERANHAWEALGRKMGFDGMTVAPIPGKGDRFFTAEVAGVRTP